MMLQYADGPLTIGEVAELVAAEHCTGTCPKTEIEFHFSGIRWEAHQDHCCDEYETLHVCVFRLIRHNAVRNKS